MRQLRTDTIIHIFAALHLIVTVTCRISGMDDSLILTILTMVMTVIVCFKRGISVEFTAAAIVLVNIAGYFIGIWGARLISLVISSGLTSHAISSFITTEILGWSLLLYSNIAHNAPRQDNASWTPRVRWLLLAAAVIFVMRMAYTEIFSSRYFSPESSYRIIRMLINNSAALLLMLCSNIIYTRFMRRKMQGRSTLLKTAIFSAFIITLSSATALIAGYNLPFRFNNTFTFNEFLLLLSITLLIELTLYCITYIADYAIYTRNAISREREKANQARFLYMKLKQQVNPHFLFNSLNILDCLVLDKKTEQASLYIHKLAGMYRYLLQNETEDTVEVRQEMRFVEMYSDLLKVRFPEGLVFRVSIPDHISTSHIVPCSIQMLVENAIKHNEASVDNILTIDISSDGENITVSNNRNPKISAGDSTGLGLKYIRQQYLDLTGREIKVSSSARDYSVTLPLLTEEKRPSLCEYL